MPRAQCPHCPHTYLHHTFIGPNVRGGDLYHCRWCGCRHIRPYEKKAQAPKAARAPKRRSK